MRRRELVFTWTDDEVAGSHKWLSYLIVTGLFTFFFGFFNVRMKPVRAEVGDSVTVFQFSDSGIGRSLAQIAEEQGPFPGRLELADGVLIGTNEMLDGFEAEGWMLYEPRLMGFKADVGMVGEHLAPTGLSTFPERARAVVGVVVNTEPTRLLPRLIPFDRETAGWLPRQLPEFGNEAEGLGAPESSRFMLGLRADGSVEHCLSLAGGATPASVAVEEWLRGVRFEAGEAERWLGLRVEFINAEEDGS